MSQNVLALSNVVAGDRKDVSIRFVKKLYDFTGVVVTCKLRSPLITSAVVHTFTPVVVFPDPTDVTTFTVGISLSGVETTNLGVGLYYGDMVVVVASAFGPYTPIQFSFYITNRITT